MRRSRVRFPQAAPVVSPGAPGPTEKGHGVDNLESWSGSAKPQRLVLNGRYARLEPLSVAQHSEDLYGIACGDGAENLYQYLLEPAPQTHTEFTEWAVRAEASEDPLFFAVIDSATQRAGGRQALMRFDQAHGVVEVGHILWGPAIARTRVATEAFFLLADYVFSTLGCRRLEWKCDSRNEPSQRAARRFGFVFEGVFRHHMVVKGHNRDTAWFSIIDDDWPLLRENFVSWLAPSNFDSDGIQKRSLR